MLIAKRGPGTAYIGDLDDLVGRKIGDVEVAVWSNAVAEGSTNPVPMDVGVVPAAEAAGIQKTFPALYLLSPYLRRHPLRLNRAW